VIDLDGVSAQALSDTIGAIYACALDPQQWPDTCRKIADLCESTAGGICVHDMRHTQNDQLFVFGYQSEFPEKLGQNYAESPMAASDIVADIGDVSALRSRLPMSRKSGSSAAASEAPRERPRCHGRRGGEVRKLGSE
jgi:hypothetical protein